MKNLITLSLIVLMNTAFASRNPQQRTCRTNGAIFWSYQITEPSYDDVGFCKYGSAILGSISLMKFFHEGISTKAVAAFYKTQRTRIQSCDQVGAQQINSIDSNDDEKLLCLFNDYSFIGKETLTNGWTHISNDALTNALVKY